MFPFLFVVPVSLYFAFVGVLVNDSVLFLQLWFKTSSLLSHQISLVRQLRGSFNDENELFSLVLRVWRKDQSYVDSSQDCRVGDHSVSTCGSQKEQYLYSISHVNCISFTLMRR